MFKIVKVLSVEDVVLSVNWLLCMHKDLSSIPRRWWASTYKALNAGKAETKHSLGTTGLYTQSQESPGLNAKSSLNTQAEWFPKFQWCAMASISICTYIHKYTLLHKKTEYKKDNNVNFALPEKSCRHSRNKRVLNIFATGGLWIGLLLLVNYQYLFK